MCTREMFGTMYIRAGRQGREDPVYMYLDQVCVFLSLRSQPTNPKNSRKDTMNPDMSRGRKTNH